MSQNDQTGRHPVPDHITNQGHDTSVGRADSPESLDQEIAEGADRTRIDPHHSLGSEDVANVDKEEHGVA